MGRKLTVAGVSVALLCLFLAGTVEAQEKKAAPSKADGDVGLMDLEKNYMILVTKDGKLITAEFGPNTKVTQLVPDNVKMKDIDLGQAATVTYTVKGNKNIATSVEYVVKAKRGE